MRTPKDIKFLLINTIKNDFTLDTDDKNAFIAESRSFRTDIPEANHTYVRYQDANYYVDQFLLDNGFVLITNNKDVYIVPKQKFLSFHKINDSLEALEKHQVNNDCFDDDSTVILRINMRNSKAFLKGLNGPFDTIFTSTMTKSRSSLNVLALVKTASWSLTTNVKKSFQQLLLSPATPLTKPGSITKTLTVKLF